MRKLRPDGSFRTKSGAFQPKSQMGVSSSIAAPQTHFTPMIS